MKYITQTLFVHPLHFPSSSHDPTGYPQMAIAGCYAGPLFNVLMGLGLSLTYATWDGTPLDIGNAFQSHLVQTTLGFLVVGLISSLIVVPLSGFVVKKWLGYYLFTLYVTFLATGLTIVLCF